MKSILGMFLIVGLMSGLLYAKPVGSNSILPYGDSVLLGCNSATIVKVAPSSSTATATGAANLIRKGTIIRNVTGSSYTVYLATYAATSSTALYPIADGAEFSDDIMPYTGIWYILGAPSISTSSVIVVEKY